MKKTSGRIRAARRAPEPAWNIARLFPAQGAWSEEEYLALNTNHFVEFSDGRIEVLTMPTTAHQRILVCLSGLLLAYTIPRKLGETLVAPLPVRLWENKYREPDVVFMLARHASRIRKEFWEGADLVMEVVSGDDQDRRRDLVTKRREYTKAGIPEYWIVDPREGQIIVLKLKGTRYVTHGRFRAGDRAASALLKGFTIEVNAVLSAAR